MPADFILLNKGKNFSLFVGLFDAGGWVVVISETQVVYGWADRMTGDAWTLDGLFARLGAFLAGAGFLISDIGHIGMLQARPSVTKERIFQSFVAGLAAACPKITHSVVDDLSGFLLHLKKYIEDVVQVSESAGSGFTHYFAFIKGSKGLCLRKKHFDDLDVEAAAIWGDLKVTEFETKEVRLFRESVFEKGFWRIFSPLADGAF